MKAFTYFLAILPLLILSSAHAGNLADRDRDGIPDLVDQCPANSFEELSRGVSNNGCPLQSDADGIPDYRDRCPNTPRGVKTNSRGCPVTGNLNVDYHVFNSRSLINIH